MSDKTTYHLDRRQFLKRTALTTAALGFPTIISASAKGANERISLGCIGVGSMGTGNMKTFLQQDDCRVVAVCDARHDRMGQAKNLVDKHYEDQGCAAIADFRELLARKDIDAVMIASQDHWHGIMGTAAAAAGKHLYLEKPLAISIVESKAIRDAVHKHSLTFQAGTWQRSFGNFRQACVLARNGQLGKLSEIQVAAHGPEYKPRYGGPMDPQPVPDTLDWEMWQGPAPRQPFNPGRIAHPDWYLIWDYCNGFITNWGVHYLDIALWGCPELATVPFEVECKGVYRNQGFTDNIESWNATFTYENGLRMLFTDNVQQETGTRFIGPDGSVHVKRSVQPKTDPASLASLRPKPGDDLLRPSWVTGDDIKEVKHKDGNYLAFGNHSHAQDFLQCIRSGKQPLSNVDATHHATVLGLIAEIAARLGRKLKWDPKSESFVNDDEANGRFARVLHNGWKLVP